MISSCNVPTVSVIVLTYNQEQTVAQTLDSILSQRTDFAFEVIIGEDASPSDNTRAVCEQYAAQHPETIKLMPKAPNKGVLRNYVDCLKACRGKYIAACAGDDWWCDEDKLQMQVDFLEAHDDYVMVYSGAIIENTSTGKKKESPLTHPSSDMFMQLLRSNFIIACTTCYRANAAKSIDFEVYIDNGFMMEDYPMWLEMAKMGKFHCIDQFLAIYVISNGTISNSKEISKQIEFENNVLQIIRYLTKNDGQVDKEEILHRHYRKLMGVGIYYGKWWYTMRQIWHIGRWKVTDWLRFGLLVTPFGFCYLQKRSKR